jgi:hypothetical protein
MQHPGASNEIQRKVIVTEDKATKNVMQHITKTSDWIAEALVPLRTFNCHEQDKPNTKLCVLVHCV